MVVTRAGKQEFAALPHGGEHAKVILTVIHDPDQHQHHCAGARKHGADERCAIKQGKPALIDAVCDRRNHG
jgi:hypothetical protein